MAPMNTMADIQCSIEQLAPDEIARPRDWLDELDARLFDEKIACDSKAGKLDPLLADARANIAAGRGEEF